MKADLMTKELLKRILDEGELDMNPRPKYEDGTSAHTLSINHIMQSFDLDKGELPLLTLRPIATKKAIGEILWIYQDQSNSLDLLAGKYGITWWDPWDIGDRTIGSVYGETVRRHNLVNNLLKDIETNPDGRRHIMNMWQEEDFKTPHGLKPCAYQTVWNVRNHKDPITGENIQYLDMCLFQRSSDFATAGSINQVQYVVLQFLFARHLGMKVGKFTWFVANIQIYDRHIDQVKEMLNRGEVEMKEQPYIWLNPDKTNFYDFTLDDIKIMNYSTKEIGKINPQLKFPIGI